MATAVTQATPVDWAWAAGLFEGEGCIYLREGVNGVQLKVAMTDHDVVIRFWNVVGHGYVNRAAPTNGVKEVWVWQEAKRDGVRHVLDGLYPYLGERRKAKADEAYLRLARTKDYKRGLRTCAESRDGYQWHRDRGEPPCPKCRQEYAVRQWHRRHVLCATVADKSERSAVD